MSRRKASERVVVTGIGWVTPLGHSIEEVWGNLLAGKSGIGKTEHFDASTFPTTFSAQVKDYDYRQYVKHPEVHEGVGFNTAYALGAASQAWKCAGLNELDAEGKLDHDRLGIYLGSGEGSLDFDNYVGSNLHAWSADKREIESVSWAKMAKQRFQTVCENEQEPNMPLTHLALEFGAMGPAYNCLTACAADWLS